MMVGSQEYPVAHIRAIMLLPAVLGSSAPMAQPLQEHPIAQRTTHNGGQLRSLRSAHVDKSEDPPKS